MGDGIKVADIAVTDDALGTDTLSLSGTDASSFAIHATSGGSALYYIGGSPDYEAKSSYAVTVSAQDSSVSGSMAVSTSYTLAITDVNEAPSAVALAHPLTSLAENSAVGDGIKVADIAVTDDALGTDTLSLSGTDASSFAIHATSGGSALYYIGGSPDYEAKSSYAVTVSAQDSSVSGSMAVSTSYTLAITDVNEAPSAVALAHPLTSLAENSAVGDGIKVADIAVTDDALGTDTLSLSGTDASSFAIHATSGGSALYYIGGSPDYEAKSSYAVTVSAQDSSVSGSMAVSTSYTLAITDVNEAPSAVALAHPLTSLAENSAVGDGIKVADIAVTDDALGTDTLSLSGTDASSFAIHATSGGSALYYIGGSPDYEAKSSYAVTVSAQDSSVSGSMAVSTSYTLAITDVNEAPSAVALAHPLTSLAENSAVGDGIKVADIAVTDDALGTDTLSLSGTDASSFAIHATSGGSALYYIGGSPDYEAKSSYAVTVSAQDSSVSASMAVHAAYTLQISNVAESDPLGDFNGDGHSDLLWQNVNGAISTWSSVGLGARDNITQNTYYSPVDPSWHAVDTLDFNGDEKADILWRNDDGSVSIWTGASSGFQQSAYNHSPVGTSWRIAGAGDFNGDGKGDILWQNTDRSISVWTSTGIGFQEATYSHAPISGGWKVEGVGDFNGDGKDDILWRNDNGGVSVWNATSNGFQEGSFYIGNVSTNWHIAGLGDFNGDGKDDILWRNDNGAVTAWEGNGTGFTQGQFNANADTSWHIDQVGDFNSDGKDDVLWRNDNGATSIWHSSGTSWAQDTYDDASVATGWHIAAHNFPV